MAKKKAKSKIKSKIKNNSKVKKPKTESIKLFFIGEDFYQKSGSTMSSIYHIKDKSRSDWGKVQLYLGSGHKVTIRQATKSEMLWAYQLLEQVNRDYLNE